MYTFILEQIIVMLYWMLTVKYGAEYFESIDIVLLGAAKSIAVLFIIKLVADVLYDAWRSRPERHNWLTGGMLVLALSLTGVGSSCVGWTVFSRLANMPVSGGAMALLCAASTVNILVFDQMIQSILGERTVMLALLKAVRERMDSGPDDFDNDAFSTYAFGT